MKCPVCGLRNPPGTPTCDCGFNLAKRADHDRAAASRTEALRPSFYARHKFAFGFAFGFCTPILLLVSIMSSIK